MNTWFDLLVNKKKKCVSHCAWAFTIEVYILQIWKPVFRVHTFARHLYTYFEILKFQFEIYHLSHSLWTLVEKANWIICKLIQMHTFRVQQYNANCSVDNMHTHHEIMVEMRNMAIFRATFWWGHWIIRMEFNAIFGIPHNEIVHLKGEKLLHDLKPNAAMQPN